MEVKEEIYVERFISLFVAVSFLKEQRILNIDSLKNYLQTFHEIDEKSLEQIDNAISKMIENRSIKKISNYNNLYMVTKKIPFKNIVYSNQEYLPEINNFFYSFNNCPVPNTKIVSKPSEYFDLLDDNFMSVFIAVSFLQEQRIFNIESIKNYLQSVYDIKEEKLNGLNNSILRLQEAKMIDPIPNFNNLYIISKKIPFREILYVNSDRISEMLKFFYSFTNYSMPNVNLISEQNDDLDVKKNC